MTSPRRSRAPLFLLAFLSALAAASCRSGGGSGGLVAASAAAPVAPLASASIAWSAPSISETTVSPGDTLAALVTITNTGAAPVVIEQAFLTAVPLVGAPSSFAPLTSATTIAPGAALVVSASRTFTAADPAGSWSIVATYLDASGAAHASATTYFVLAAPGPPAFVTVDRANGRFLLAGQPFYFCGTDAYYLAQEHAYGSPVTTDALDAARAVGMRVVRTIGYFDGYDVAGTTSSDPAIIQLSPGVYRESGFQGMDFVISEAGKRGIKLVINLVNNWTSFGGMQQYVQWAGLTDHDAFFTNPAVKQFYQNYLRDFVNRRNTFTGIAYKDDPTILGWELANEARCASDPGATQGILAAWYQEMATYLKSLDSNHLVSTGEEGNDVTTSGYSSYTNGSWLDGTTGSSYRANIALSAIDWGTVHVYPDAAGMTDPLNDGSNWILDHVKIAAAQGKPLFVGEYGLQTSPHSIYASWLDVVASSGAAGSAVWEMIPPSRAAQTTENTDVLYPNDPEVSALENDAVLMNAK